MKLPRDKWRVLSSVLDTGGLTLAAHVLKLDTGETVGSKTGAGP